jgi:thiamine biosynthesis protein ThiI
MAKAIALVSGGIDSAAAISLALEQGLEVVALHYSTKPFADDRAERKAVDLVRHLRQRFGREIKLLVVPFGSVLKAIAEGCDRKFNCVLCRRMMLRIAERIALEEKASALLSGESLGQVASQTLTNLNAEAGCISLPVIRPLLGLDKLEIEAIARSFETLGISTMPSACCSIPEKPATSARRQAVEEMEKGLEVEELVQKAFDARQERNVQMLG